MTPILVRPVREQLEHDRVIRLLQQKLKRKYQVAINQGAETVASITIGDYVVYPDVMLTAAGHHKPEVLIEVETAESVNNIEAMSEWVRLAQTRAAFHLYVPVGYVDAARRLCGMHDIRCDEIFTYHPIGDEMRFTSVWKAPAGSRPAPKPEPPAPERSSRREAERPARRETPAQPAAARGKRPEPGRRTAQPARRASGGTSTARKTTTRRPAAAAKPSAVKAGAKKTAAKVSRAQKRK